MSADADDLLERVARAQDRDIPTSDEVKADLAAALDELERRFPDGQPSRGDGLTRLRYRTLMSRITHCQWQLDNGQCVEFPRERRSHLDQSEGGDSWKSFLEEHPELADAEAKGAEPQVAEREPLSFTDAELLRALRETCRQWDRRMPKHRRREGVLSSCVADTLAGVTIVTGEGRVPKELVPTQRDVIRVGVALARLARGGRIERTNRRWESNRWAPKKRGGANAS